MIPSGNEHDCSFADLVTQLPDSLVTLYYILLRYFHSYI